MLFISQRFQQFSAFINSIMKYFLLFLFLLLFPLFCPLPPDCIHDDVESADPLSDRIIKVTPGIKCILTLSAFSIDRVLLLQFLFSSSAKNINIRYWQPLHHKSFFHLEDNTQYLPNVFFLKGLFNLVLTSVWSPLCLCWCEPSQQEPWRYSLLIENQFVSCLLSSRASTAWHLLWFVSL